MQLIKRHHQNFDFGIGSEIIYDPVATQILMKEKTEPCFYPLDIITKDALFQDKINSREDEQKAIYQSKKMIIDELKKSMVKPRSDKVIRQQNLLVNTEKEVLKYEYFQKIKGGCEEEHLVYLMSNLKKNLPLTQEDERIKKRHERQLLEFDMKNNQIIGKVKQAQDLLTQNKLDEVYQEICETYKRTNKLLMNYADNYRIIKLRKQKEEETGAFDYMRTPEKYKNKIQQDHKKKVQKRNWRIKKANKMKRDMVLKRKQEIEETIEKKSLDYRQNQLKKDSQKTIIKTKLKKLITLLNLELVINLINKLAFEGKVNKTISFISLGLNQKKIMFKYNMKARIIQMFLRKHIVIF